jgi:hypothetical protein
LRGDQRQRLVSWRVCNDDSPRLSAERYRRPLLAEASSLLERMGDLKDSEIVAMSTNDLNADRQPFCRESSWYGNGRAGGHADAVGRSHPIDVILHPNSFYLSRPVERGVEWPQVTYAITAKVLELDGVMIELDRIAEQWYGKKRKEN